jgi:hypothetical protein
VPVSLVPALALLYFYVSTFLSILLLLLLLLLLLILFGCFFAFPTVLYLLHYCFILVPHTATLNYIYTHTNTLTTDFEERRTGYKNGILVICDFGYTHCQEPTTS